MNDENLRFYRSIIKRIVLCVFISMLLGDMFYMVLNAKVSDTRLSCLVAIVIASMSFMLQLIDEIKN